MVVPSQGTHPPHFQNFGNVSVRLDSEKFIIKPSGVNLQKTNYFGILSWDGKSPEIAQLKDVQDLVELTVGDTIVTSGYSSTFPPNIPVGSINSYRLNDTEDLYIIDVKLFNDMKNLEHVYIIKNTDINELEALNLSDE